MNRVLLAGVALVAWPLTSCSSVSLPRERYWRLELPPARTAAPAQGAVLRVADLPLANALQGDCLLVQQGRAELAPLDREHWIAPLDRLVTDAVVLGLSRSGSFALVKGAGDPGREDFELRGRVVDFAVADREAGREARVVCQFWLERQQALVFQGEFAAQAPAQGADAAAGVAALSLALQQVLDQLGERMQQAGIFDRAAVPAPAK